MRITNNMLLNNMMQSLSNNLNRTQTYFNQLSSGKKISLPSDDPIVASKALKLRTDVAEIEQYKRNTDDAMSWMDITEAAMNQMTEVIHRMKEITNQAANGSNTQEDLDKIHEEATQLREQIIHLGNATYAGRYIFSGFKTDKPLLNQDGTFNVPIENGEQIKFEIGIRDDININVPGNDLFNDGINAAEGDKSSFVDTFDKIIEAMGTDNKDELSSLLGDIDDQLGNLMRVRAGLGARMNRVELSANRIDDDKVNYTRLMSLNEDVDIAEAIMKLQNEENVYRASLATGARVIQPSLVDFLG
ncbi:MAG: flagellar hook-associated protein FlgL [Acetivibrionales bacterium]|jgi:flagellar hook-associated protein 3 FlgL|nr:flagellar hook-associated protein FlgL [Clostridiaceae bacterium]